jgi:Zn-dependent protease with chaperone function
VKEVLFTLLLALAWFGAVNVVVSAVAASVGGLIDRGALRLRPSNAASVLLALKLVPGVMAVFFTLALFLPAQWQFEPEGAEESAGYTLVAFGVLGVVTLALAARRAVRDARMTRALERGWIGRANGPRTLAGGRVPVYCLPDQAPIISLAGLRWPRVFVARSVLDAFTSDELDVSLAHELAHHQARDNVKRLMVACSPDLLALWPSGRVLERRWRAAVEFAADARAVAGSQARALSLASALLKVARLAPAVGASAGGSYFYDGTLLSARIDRLLASSGPGDAAPSIGRAWSISLGGMTLVAAALAAEGVWLGVHLATEGLVRFLP